MHHKQKAELNIIRVSVGSCCLHSSANTADKNLSDESQAEIRFVDEVMFVAHVTFPNKITTC